VATDVGDARRILLDIGIIVTPGDSSAVADGVLAILDCDERENSTLQKMATGHIRDNYSIDRLVLNTLNVLNENEL
jgi:glycosyltransferase involved in cell wall biosynthesis